MQFRELRDYIYWTYIFVLNSLNSITRFLEPCNYEYWTYIIHLKFNEFNHAPHDYKYCI